MAKFLGPLGMVGIFVLVGACSAESPGDGHEATEATALLTERDLSQLRELGVDSVIEADSQVLLLGASGESLGNVTLLKGGTVRGTFDGHDVTLRWDESTLEIACDGRALTSSRTPEGGWMSADPTLEASIAQSCSSALEVSRIVANRAFHASDASDEFAGDQAPTMEAICYTKNTWVFGYSCSRCWELTGCHPVNGWTCTSTCDVGAVTTSCSQTGCWSAPQLEMQMQ